MVSNFRNQDEIISGFEVYENSFKLILGDDPQLVHHATGFEWTEGPAYFVDGDYLLFSDISFAPYVNTCKSHVCSGIVVKSNTNFVATNIF